MSGISPTSSGPRRLGRSLVIAAGGITLICLVYAWADWSGHHAWALYQENLLHRGIDLDFAHYIPPPVADGDNFATTPFLAPLTDLNRHPVGPQPGIFRDTNGYGRAQKFVEQAPSQVGMWTNPVVVTGKWTDFPQILEAMKPNHHHAPPPHFADRTAAASAMLAALKKFDPVLEEIQAATSRPESRFNLNYDEADPADILLPHLGVLMSLARTFAVRASAELAVNQPKDAFEDAKAIFYLAQSVRNEPIEVSYFVRLRIFSSAERIIWEGLAQRRWSEDQLAVFIRDFQSLSLLRDFTANFDASQAAFGNKMFQFIIRDPHNLQGMQNNWGPMVMFLPYLPSGWLYREQLVYNKLSYDDARNGFDPATETFHPMALRRALANLPPASSDLRSFLDHRLLFSSVYPDYLKKVLGSFEETAAGVTMLNETVVACGLERYRLEKGELPPALADLVPRYIAKVPLDVFDGKPLEYAPVGTDSFKLTSIGWDGKNAPWAWPPYSGPPAD